MLAGGSTSGKIYFDAVGEAPTGVAYNGGGESLVWIEPPAASEEEAAPEEEAPPAEEAAPEGGAPAESESADSGASSEANADVATSEEE